MVHKNINSSNIILAEVKTGSEASITTDSALFLTNWRYARDDSAATDLSGASNWASQLYQHPRDKCHVLKPNIQWAMTSIAWVSLC